MTPEIEKYKTDNLKAARICLLNAFQYTAPSDEKSGRINDIIEDIESLLGVK